jgi:hypothetical protein
MSDQGVLEAYSRLKSLRGHLPDEPVGAAYVAEYHAALDLLEAGRKVSLEGFRIPETQVRPVEVGSNYVTGEVHYSAERFCDRRFFLIKIDGALALFDLLDAAASSGEPPVRLKPIE